MKMTDLMKQAVADLEKLPEARQAELVASWIEAIRAELKFREEREDWARLATESLSRAYGDDEPEYTDADLLK